MNRRALHFVFKIGDRKKTFEFFQNVLGMQILRHEEFEEGCKASCNGPYDGKWSKSMIGYGPEDHHFVIELTYNYGIGAYELGNDFQGITIHSSVAFENIKKLQWPIENATSSADTLSIRSPDGYPFTVVNKNTSSDPVQKVHLGVTDLTRTRHYWHDLLGMKLFDENDKKLVLGYHEDQCKMEFELLPGAIDHATAFGRTAFSCPRDQLVEIERSISSSKQGEILKPLVSLDTPGKATVEVVILGDPDGHEICFVGDEAFRELSQPDPRAQDLLDEAMSKDKSNDWFNKRGGKATA